MKILTAAWVLAACAVLVGGAGAAVLSAREIEVTALTTPPRLWAGLAAGQASATAALGVATAVAAGALLAVGAVVRALRGNTTWVGLEGVALWCGALAALSWFDAALYRALVLVDVSHVEAVARLAPLRPLVGGIGFAIFLLAAPAVWMRGGRSARVTAVAVGIALVAQRWSIHRVLTLGPDPAIAVVAPILPHHAPALAQRVPWGCVLWRPAGEWVGISLVRDLPRETTGCPEPIAPGSFERGNVLLFAVPAETPTEELAGWTADPQGDVGILVRLEADAPRRLAEWRLSEVRVGVRNPPVEGNPRTRPLSGAVLLDAPAWGEDLAALLGHALRVELLVMPEAAPTVGDLLAVCDEAVRAHPRGLQCTFAAGDPGAWTTWASSSPDSGRSPRAP